MFIELTDSELKKMLIHENQLDHNEKWLTTMSNELYNKTIALHTAFRYRIKNEKTGNRKMERQKKRKDRSLQ